MNVRYDFGRNWSELAKRFHDDHVRRAMTDLQRLVGDIEDRSFLDIGCGSGLHAVAALRLGASRVEAVDYDPDSVETSRAVLARFARDGAWQVGRADVLEPDTLPAGTFDIVYSWGVLHHTGDMWTAIRNAAQRVAPGGRLAIALYVRTPLCHAWTVEKRLYSRQRWLRPIIKYPFAGALLAARAIRNRDAFAYVKNYRNARGMEFMVDVDDWLGGYPYQSVEAGALEAEVERLGFRVGERFNVRPRIGLFGTGCGEWRFERPSS